ncbi:MAG TPA: DUF2007 domain-containing protein [Flavobacteriaceae bacterium]|nr:DUF2007 domain-containing protein [Flavobacteriaceae bacterium]
MTTEDKYVPVYSGYDVNIQYLQNIFAEKDIDSWVRTESGDAVLGGSGSTTPGQSRLLVLQSQQEAALKIIEDVFPEEEVDEEE